MLRDENTSVIKTLADVHNCYRVQHNRYVTIEFMANKFIEKFKSDAPIFGGPVDHRQLAKNLCVSYHETWT